VQKSVRFTTTFEFERKYLWNRWRQRQHVNGVDESYLLCVEQKKICKIRSTVNKVISAHVNLQCAFGVYQCIWVRATWIWCRGNFTCPLISPNRT